MDAQKLLLRSTVDTKGILRGYTVDTQRLLLGHMVHTEEPSMGYGARGRRHLLEYTLGGGGGVARRAPGVLLLY